MIIKLEEIFSSDVITKSYNGTVQMSPDNFKEFLIKEFKPCDVQVKIYSISEKFFIDFNYELDAVYQCSRCLTDVEKRVSDSFSRELLFKGDKFEEGIGVLIVENDEIDVKEILLKSLYLALESNILCKEECKGLCPKCGIDLNNSNCDCDLNDIDPRFAKLEGLKEKLSK